MALPNAIDLEVFQNAIYEWFSTALDCQVIWAQKSVPRPDYPYGTLNILAGPTPMGAWEHKTTTDLLRPPGEEVEFEVRVPCQFTISCQAFVAMPEGREPNSDGMALVTRAQSRLFLPSELEKFRAANISVARTGAVRNLSSIDGDAFVSRAGIDVVFNASLSLAEYTGYIAKVHATSTQLGIDQIFGDV